MKFNYLCTLPLVGLIACSPASETKAAEKHPAAPSSSPTTPSAGSTVKNKAASEKAAEYPADNTGKNARDRSGDTVTPLDQAENEADLALTKELRQAIVAIPDLSTNGKNIKIVTQMGKVTLRGPVASAAEKESIETTAKNLAGVQHVDNLLEIEAK